MKYVVKLGGASLEDKVTPPRLRLGHRRACPAMATRSPLSTAAAFSSPAFSPRWARSRKFISGLRVTDAETRDAALMVLAGRVNKSLVAALGPAWLLRRRSHRRRRPRLPRSQEDHHARPRLRRRDRRHRSPLARRHLDHGRSPRHLPPSPLALTASITTSMPTRWPPPAPSPPRADALVFLTDVPRRQRSRRPGDALALTAADSRRSKSNPSSPAACCPSSTPVAKPSPTASSASASFLQSPQNCSPI